MKGAGAEGIFGSGKRRENESSLSYLLRIPEINLRRGSQTRKDSEDPTLQYPPCKLQPLFFNWRRAKIYGDDDRIEGNVKGGSFFESFWPAYTGLSLKDNFVDEIET
jgi:hypothetical protein